jgi:hypothetical protein
MKGSSGLIPWSKVKSVGGIDDQVLGMEISAPSSLLRQLAYPLIRTSEVIFLRITPRTLPASEFHSTWSPFVNVFGIRVCSSENMEASGSISRKFFGANVILIYAGFCEHLSHCCDHRRRTRNIVDRSLQIAKVLDQHFTVDEALLAPPT